MAVISVEVPEYQTGDRVPASVLNAVVQAVLNSLDPATLAGQTGLNAFPFVGPDGQISGRQVMPGNNLTAADVISGLSTGGLHWNAKANADVGAAQTVAIASNAVTLPFGASLLCKTNMTANISAGITVSGLPEFAFGIWEMWGHASSDYTVSIPSGGTWFNPGGLESFVVPANSRVTALIRKRAAELWISWDAVPYKARA